MTILGKWQIIEMELWEQKDVELMGPAFIEFGNNGAGEFNFIAVEGCMDCHHIKKNGLPFVDFTWDGNDECDPVNGRGWATIENDILSGRIYFHQGEKQKAIELVQKGLKDATGRMDELKAFASKISKKI